LLCLVAVAVRPIETRADLPPYPPSPVITDVDWAPASSIVRMAQGGDNWPITWADDGNMYAAYGDGFGFIPYVPTKLSLGFARVSGDPENPTGVNIRSATGEQTGNGRGGKKASGMLMVDGVLYMWVRNVNSDGEGCQLAWSTDRAQTWTWANWKFDELGYCTSINFGQDYAGARDNFVYTYSPNGPSAYDTSDSMVLMRVPKDSMTDRSAYEFFAGVDGNGQPTWVASINQRQPVFEHQGSCRRSGISYNAGLDRYIWWQNITGTDTRFQGGFAIFDAPEPWGPWSIVYYTEDWDVGPGDAGVFPTKWMSADGLTMNLVFSGDDAFSVREVSLSTGVGVDTTPPAAPGNLRIN